MFIFHVKNHEMVSRDIFINIDWKITKLCHVFFFWEKKVHSTFAENLLNENMKFIECKCEIIEQKYRLNIHMEN